MNKALKWAPGIFVGAVAALLLGMAAGWLISLRPSFGPPQVPSFSAGQMVRMKAFGNVGMVISVDCPRSVNGMEFICTYDVRFPASTVQQIREYELEAK